MDFTLSKEHEMARSLFKEFAEKEVKPLAPVLFKNAGASCVYTGRCPEGEMTCGKFSEMLKLREE